MATQLRPVPARAPATCREGNDPPAPRVVLSFDVEEHFRIEAGWGLPVSEEFRAHCARRVDVATRRLLDLLARRGAKATFFVLGSVAERHPSLVRAIAEAGHEVASHGHEHLALHRLTPEGFRADLRRARAALEQASRQPVVGFRAPTFSVTRATAWAMDVLAEEGYLYDSSIYPVRHDRYGIASAPRAPFLARGQERTILEMPPATLRLLGWQAPMGGGGYFRLFPLWATRWAVRQTLRDTSPPVAMLYFHPWEFDPEQQPLALGRLSRWRTYVGVRRTASRLEGLLAQFGSSRAIDAARDLTARPGLLPCFPVAAQAGGQPSGVNPG